MLDAAEANGTRVKPEYGLTCRLSSDQLLLEKGAS